MDDRVWKRTTSQQLGVSAAEGVPMNKDRQMGEPPRVVKVDEVVVT